MMALRDHFVEKWAAYEHSHPIDEESKRPTTKDKKPTDKWALAYLTALKVQAISEAFDDDASGFITITEVNSFTTSRPDWR